MVTLNEMYMKKFKKEVLFSNMFSKFIKSIDKTKNLDKYFNEILSNPIYCLNFLYEFLEYDPGSVLIKQINILSEVKIFFFFKYLILNFIQHFVFLI